MSRCLCCNIEMKWRDFKMLQDDNSEENLCSTCLSIAYSPNHCKTHSYQFEDITEVFFDEGITRPKLLND